MKVIDLLNKITNGEVEKTTEFLVDGNRKNTERTLEWYGLRDDCYNLEEIKESLQSNIEIIEEENKLEKFEDKWLYNSERTILEAEMMKKINTIIDYLKDKEDKGE